MPLVILHHLLNVSVQLANKRGFKQQQQQKYIYIYIYVKICSPGLQPSNHFQQ
jgi:hypothetical protein